MKKEKNNSTKQLMPYTTPRLELLETFNENRENAYCVAFSPNKKTFAAAGGLRSVFIYDAFEKKPIGGLTDHRQSVYALLFAPSGRWFFSTGRDGFVFVYDEKFDKVATLLPEYDMATANPQLYPNYSLALNANETELAVGATGGVLRIYDTETWKLKSVFPVHQGNIRSVAYSSNGKLMATGSSDRTVNIIHPETKTVLQTISGHADTVFSVLFSPDSKLFMTGGKDARLRIWDVEGTELKPKVKILAHTFSIKAMAYLPISQELITVSQDKTIKRWDFENAVCLETVDRTFGGHIFTINSVAISTDEKFLVTGSDDKKVKLWSILSN
ncbi:MAG: WD40 repeat domain-containing protein [Chloroherpetonaceae bacterium]|nr:WD40 repeat domain-containing protein [Chloroherpetonaceae bacterium]